MYLKEQIVFTVIVLAPIANHLENLLSPPPHPLLKFKYYQNIHNTECFILQS